MALRFVALIALLLSFATPAVAGAVRVAVTGDQRLVMTEVVEAYKTANPRESVELKSDAAGKLFTAIRGGQSTDLFVALDRHYPERLVKAGLAVEPVVHYASNPLVLWAANPKTGLQGL